MPHGPFPECQQVSYFIHIYKSLYPGFNGRRILHSAMANMLILKSLSVYFQPSNNWVKIKNKNHPHAPEFFKNWMRIYLFIWYGLLKKIPTLPNFFGVVTLNTYIFIWPD